MIARLALSLPLVLLSAGAHPCPDDPLTIRIEERLQASRQHWIDFRRDLHRHPELSGEERRTAAAVARELEALGLEVRTGVGGHGVVGVLHGRAPGRVIGFRADMDAVRTSDPDPVEYRSETPGVRHACGHDLHTTVGVALAQSLAEVRESFAGTVVFYFQPAEETGRGAGLMIADGALEEPVPEECYAFHSSQLDVGHIGVTPARALAMRDSIRVTLEGAGDLRSAARSIERAIQSLTTLEDPKDTSSRAEDFLTAYVFRTRPGAGEATLTLEGQATLTSAELRAEARHELEEFLRELEPVDVHAELEWRPRTLAGVYNDPALVEASAALLSERLGEEAYEISHTVPLQFSEDFGLFQDHAPGVMYWLGVSNPTKGTLGYPHSPNFVADDEAIFVGARTMAAVVLSRLEARQESAGLEARQKSAGLEAR